MTATTTTTAHRSGPGRHRRPDAGTVRLNQRDIDGLVLCAEHASAPYDLLADALGVQPARLRGIVARWRQAGLAASGRLGPGPAWCWLIPAGMAATGLPYPATRPALGRLAHLRAVLAARLWLEATTDWRIGQPWWRSERRIRARQSAAGATHRPDAEAHWPSLTASPHAGQIWAIEVELTPKPLARTVQIMTALTAPAHYARVVYLGRPGRPARPGPRGRPRPGPARRGDHLGPAARRLHPRTRISAREEETPMRDNQENAAGRPPVNGLQGPGEKAINPPSAITGPRIISYNLRVDERPGGPDGLKVRWKFRIETGRKAEAVDARQAEAIKEALLWLRTHKPRA